MTKFYPLDLNIVLESRIRDFCRIHSNQVPWGRICVRKKLIRSSEFKKKNPESGQNFIGLNFIENLDFLKIKTSSQDFQNKKKRFVYYESLKVVTFVIKYETAGIFIENCKREGCSNQAGSGAWLKRTFLFSGFLPGLRLDIPQDPPAPTKYSQQNFI